MAAPELQVRGPQVDESHRLRGRQLLFVVNDAGFFRSHRLPIARAALTAGMSVAVASPYGPDVRRLREEGVEHHHIPLSRSGLHVLDELGTVMALRALYRRTRPDVVHHVTMKPVLYGSLASRAADVPAVVNAISGLGFLFIAHGGRARLRRMIMTRLARAAFRHRRLRAIFQNNDDAALFRELGIVAEEQVVMIRGSGVDLQRFVPVVEPEAMPVIVLPARMLWDKGVGEFVEASRQLACRGITVRCALVGPLDPGNPSGISRAQIQAWQREGVVEWWELRDDMPEVLASANIVCLPSYREGMPKSLLEAAAAGRAIVTTDVPGCRDAVRAGVSGLLVPPRDPAALADALEWLIAHPTERRAFGLEARRLAEEAFSDEAVVTATLELYGRVLS